MIRSGLMFAVLNGAMILILKASIAHHHDVAQATFGVHLAEVGLTGAVLIIILSVAAGRWPA